MSCNNTSNHVVACHIRSDPMTFEITSDAEFTVCPLVQGILRFKRPAPQKQSCAWQLSAKKINFGSRNIRRFTIQEADNQKGARHTDAKQ